MAKSPRGFLFNFVTDIKQIIMNAHTIFERDLNGEMVSPSDPGYDELINAIWDTMKMATELNTGYHTPDEVRRILSVILGCEVDESITLLPPFYVDYGKHIKIGKVALFNSVVRFSDEGVLLSVKMSFWDRK